MKKIKDTALVCMLFAVLFVNAQTIKPEKAPELIKPTQTPTLTAGISLDIYNPSDITIEKVDADVVSEPNPEESEVKKVTKKKKTEKPKKKEPEKEYISVDSTAYYNKYNAHCADGTWPYVGTLAGAPSWIGKSVELYDSDKNYMGDYTFHDTGYGQSTGWGSSIFKGRTYAGTIEAGLCIDIFMNTESECYAYGRRTVYMVWKEN